MIGLRSAGAWFSILAMTGKWSLADSVPTLYSLHWIAASVAIISKHVWLVAVMRVGSVEWIFIPVTARELMSALPGLISSFLMSALRSPMIINAPSVETSSTRTSNLVNQSAFACGGRYTPTTTTQGAGLGRVNLVIVTSSPAATYLSCCSDNCTGFRVLLVYVATPPPHAVLSCLFRLYPGIDNDLCVTFASIFVSVRVITSCFTVNSLTSCHFARRPLIFHVASQSLPAASFLAELGAIFDVVVNGFLITGLCVLLLTEFLFEDRLFLCAGCAGADGVEPEN